MTTSASASTPTAFNWVQQHALGLAAGFSYFNTYVNPANGWVVGWVARENLVAGQPSPPYLLFYFLGQTGQGLAQATRGTATHAMDAIDGVIRREGVEVGIYQQNVPALTRQIVLADAVRAKRGW